MVEPGKDQSEHVFIRRVLIVLGIAALFFLAWQLRTLLLMIFGAVVVATVFRSFADRIAPLVGGRTSIAITLSIVVILGILVILIGLFGSHVVQQVELLKKTLPAAWKAVEYLRSRARTTDEGSPHALNESLERVAMSRPRR